MILACGRMFLFNWSIDEAYGDLKRAGVEPSFEAELRGSNQFAIAPSRSAEGAAILAIDPHLSWYGPSRYWEVRIHAGALEGSGVSRAGSPYLGLGHTRNLAWAMTTGGPDTADVYALELDEAGARYLYDGGVARPRAPRDDDRGARRRAASRDDPAFAPRAAHRAAWNEGVGGEDRLPRRARPRSRRSTSSTSAPTTKAPSARWRCACSSRRT